MFFLTLLQRSFSGDVTPSQYGAWGPAQPLLGVEWKNSRGLTARQNAAEDLLNECKTEGLRTLIWATVLNSCQSTNPFQLLGCVHSNQGAQLFLRR